MTGKRRKTPENTKYSAGKTLKKNSFIVLYIWPKSTLTVMSISQELIFKARNLFKKSEQDFRVNINFEQA